MVQPRKSLKTVQEVHTARITYRGADRLDITRKSAGPDGLPFAPSWAILSPVLKLRRAGQTLGPDLWAWYCDAYREEMRLSYRRNRAAWAALLARPEVTLCCYCTDSARCHRTLLAGFLGHMGAEVRGER
jgi:uncharacterized protein YeaO (DUF488 family)